MASIPISGPEEVYNLNYTVYSIYNRVDLVVIFHQVVPRVDGPTLMLTINKQTVINKAVTICNTKFKNKF